MFQSLKYLWCLFIVGCRKHSTIILFNTSFLSFSYRAYAVLRSQIFWELESNVLRPEKDGMTLSLDLTLVSTGSHLSVSFLYSRAYFSVPCSLIVMF